MSAAIADVSRKGRRLAELDQQLDAARQALVALQSADTTSKEPEAPSLDAAMPEISLDQMKHLWVSLKEVWFARPYMKELHMPATASTSKLVLSLKERLYGSPTEESMRDTRKTDYKRYHREALAEESDPSIIVREAQKDSHLHHESRAVEHVVLQLLSRAAKIHTCARRGQNPSFDEARDLVSRSAMQYTYPIIDRERWRRNQLLLNKCLREVIALRNIPLREKIGRICYNLLVSAYAPDIHHYNTLIVAFDEAGLHAFAEAIIWSFFHGRLLRPTALTYIAILNHCKVVGNHGRFLMALARIAGCDSAIGGKIARRHIEDCVRDGQLNEWASDTDLRTQIGEWVYEHVPLNRAIVAEIITGLLRFHMFHHAVHFFFACVQCEVFLSAAVVKNLLDECVAALDWKGAFELIYGLLVHDRSWKAFLLTGDVAADWYLINRIYTLLDICGLRYGPQWTSREYLDALGIPPERLAGLLFDLELHEQWLHRPCFPESFKGKPDMAVGAKSKLLQLESISKEYVYVRKTTKSIESKLLYPDFPLEWRVSMAHHIGGAALQQASQLIKDVEDMLRSIVGFGPWLYPIDSDRRMEARKRYLRRAREEASDEAETGLEGEATGSSRAEALPAQGNLVSIHTCPREAAERKQRQALVSQLRALRHEVDQPRVETVSLQSPERSALEEEMISQIRALRRGGEEPTLKAPTSPQEAHQDSASLVEESESLAQPAGTKRESTEQPPQGTSLALALREQHGVMVPLPEGSRFLDIIRSRYRRSDTSDEGVLRHVQKRRDPAAPNVRRTEATQKSRCDRSNRDRSNLGRIMQDARISDARTPLRSRENEVKRRRPVARWNEAAQPPSRDAHLARRERQGTRRQTWKPGATMPVSQGGTEMNTKQLIALWSPTAYASSTMESREDLDAAAAGKNSRTTPKPRMRNKVRRGMQLLRKAGRELTMELPLEAFAPHLVEPTVEDDPHEAARVAADAKDYKDCAKVRIGKKSKKAKSSDGGRRPATADIAAETQGQDSPWSPMKRQAAKPSDRMALVSEDSGDVWTTMGSASKTKLSDRDKSGAQNGALSRQSSKARKRHNDGRLPDRKKSRRHSVDAGAGAGAGTK